MHPGRQAGDELVEAAVNKQLNKTIARYGRVDLLCIDELGYTELDHPRADLLFQVLSARRRAAGHRLQRSFQQSAHVPGQCRGYAGETSVDGLSDEVDDDPAGRSGVCSSGSTRPPRHGRLPAAHRA
ncbi:ATP-binding protein [Actinomadura madurae]|uniref:ATP-binding protein n=1 Tax=Actinomadura madurae TaxID=1993 RepID=UPI0034DABF84